MPPFSYFIFSLKSKLNNSPPQAPIFAFCILHAPIRPRRGRVQLAKSAQTHLRCVWGDFCESAPGLCRSGTTKRLPMGARTRFLGHAPIRPRRGRVHLAKSAKTHLKMCLQARNASQTHLRCVCSSQTHRKRISDAFAARKRVASAAKPNRRRPHREKPGVSAARGRKII